MERKQIRTLLEKYYGGNTSLAEEQELRKVLSGPDLPREFYPDRDSMLVLEAGKKVEPAEGFEERLLSAIRAREESRATKVKPLRRAIVLVSGIAAGVVLLVGTYLLFQTGRSHSDTFSDPQLAYMEAKNTLLLVSELMNRGTPALENFRKLDAGMQELSHLNKLSTAASPLENLSAYEKGLKQLQPIEYIYKTQEIIKSR